MNKNHKQTQGLSNTIKPNNIHITGTPQEETENKAENLFEEIIAENFPNLGKETEIQIQEAQKAPNKINLRRSTPRHKIIKTAKSNDWDSFLKAVREKKTVTYKRKPHKAISSFFSRNFAGQKLRA